jgi:poly(A) polymerase Pap1
MVRKLYNEMKQIEIVILEFLGSRVTDEILRLIPDIPTFRMALRCIKFWAQRRFQIIWLYLWS